MRKFVNFTQKNFKNIIFEDSIITMIYLLHSCVTVNRLKNQSIYFSEGVIS